MTTPARAIRAPPILTGGCARAAHRTERGTVGALKPAPVLSSGCAVSLTTETNIVGSLGCNQARRQLLDLFAVCRPCLQLQRHTAPRAPAVGAVSPADLRGEHCFRSRPDGEQTAEFSLLLRSIHCRRWISRDTDRHQVSGTGAARLSRWTTALQGSLFLAAIHSFNADVETAGARMCFGGALTVEKKCP